MKRPNVHVRTHAHATNIIFEGKRAVGVRYIKGGKGGTPVEVRADKEVILSGGTYNSPQLLQLSGIGSPRAAGLSTASRCATRSPASARTARPLRAALVARVKNIDTINELRRGLSLWVEALKWATTRRRPALALADHGLLLLAFRARAPKARTCSSTFTPASYKEGVQGQLDDEPGMTVASWQQRPESRGYVRVRSADPFEPPIIQTNYLVEELDRRILVAGMRLARRLLLIVAAGAVLRLRGLSRATTCRATTSSSPPPSERGTTTFHPGCTCRMGPRRSNRPWSTTSCACTGCRACAWSTPRSCRA